ncbi:MAG: hypothetical protein ACKVKO_09695 [Acidimicrobiales bacterium]
MPAHRGATAVEYALVVALVVAGLSITLGDLSHTSANAVQDRGDRIGNPQAYSNVVDPGGVTGGVVETDLEPPAEGSNDVHLAAIVNPLSIAIGSKWSASVSVQVNSADDLPATAATVQGHWLIVNGDGQTDTHLATCETDALGGCTVTIDALKTNGGQNADFEAWFIYDSLVVTSTVYTWNSAADTTDHGTPATVLICRPDLAPNATEDACE